MKRGIENIPMVKSATAAESVFFSSYKIVDKLMLFSRENIIVFLRKKLSQDRNGVHT